MAVHRQITEAAWGSPPILLSYAFRPFFLLGAVFAIVAILLWVAMLHAAGLVPVAPDPVAWHAHEMLFGFAGAAIAGFLLTAVATWTGRPPVAGPLLGALVAAWLAGRAAMLLGARAARRAGRARRPGLPRAPGRHRDAGDRGWRQPAELRHRGGGDRLRRARRRLSPGPLRAVARRGPGGAVPDGARPARADHRHRRAHHPELHRQLAAAAWRHARCHGRGRGSRRS